MKQLELISRSKCKHRIACIGTRDITTEERQLLHRIGAWLARNGYTISTGNAIGSDQAFASGGNAVNPTKVELWLPWETYESGAIVRGNVVHKRASFEHMEFTKQFHPNWEACSQGARALHARNVGIILGCGMVVALPGTKKLGGTGQGLRIAKHLGIPIRNLRCEKDLQAVMKSLEE